MPRMVAERVLSQGAVQVFQLDSTNSITSEGKIVITTNPPSGMCKILNLYWNPSTQKVVVTYDDTPVE